MVGLEGTSGGHLGQHHWSSQLPRTMTRWILTISMYGDSTTSLGNLCQCSVALRNKKKCFLMFKGTSCVSVWAHCLVAPLRRAWLCLLCTLPSGFYVHIGMIPLSFLFSRLNSHSFLCLSLLERDYSHHIIFLALCWTLSNMAMSLLSWEALNFSPGRSGAVEH